MAYEPYDPLAELGILPPRVTPQGLSIPTLPPEQADSILSQLLGGAKSGVQAVGTLLGTLGRPVRTAIAGNFGDVLPSIIDPSRAVSGEELAKKMGLLEGDEREGLGHLVGPALELATDPLTYLSLGGSSALTAAGKTAEKAGTLAPRLAQRIASGQGGLMGLGLPLTDLSVPLGTGATAQKIAQGLGSVYDVAANSLPGRVGAAAFNKVYEGTINPFLQNVLGKANEAAVPRQFAEADKINDIFRSVAGIPDAQQSLQMMMEGKMPLAAAGTPLGDAARQLKVMQTAGPLDAQIAGLRGAERANWAPREAADVRRAAEEMGGRFERPQSPFAGSQVERQPHWDERVMTEGTVGLNKATIDPRVAGPDRVIIPYQTTSAADVQQALRNEYMGVTPAEESIRTSLNNAGNALTDPKLIAQRDALNQKWTVAEALEKRLAKINPEDVAAGKPFFNENFRDTLVRSRQATVAAEEKAKSLIEGLAEKAIPQAQAAFNDVPITNVLKSAGLGPNAEAMFQRLAGAADYIPAEVAQAVAKHVRSFTEPEVLNPLLKAWDNVTTAFKVGVSTIFPSKYFRDGLQNLFMAWTHDLKDPRFSEVNPLAWSKPITDAVGALRGGAIRGIADNVPMLRGMSDADATAKLLDLARARNLLGGEASRSAFEYGAPAAGWSWNPLKIAGLGKNTETAFAPAKLGGMAMEGIDNTSKLGGFIAAMRQGMTPDAAAARVTQALYDYGGLSQFESKVMRRVVPFYTWMRRNLPEQIRQIVTEPGGKTASAIKFETGFGQQQGFVPPQVAERGLAIPVGQEDNGTRRYLSNTELPYESAFNLLPIGGRPVQEMAQSIADQFGPQLKIPLELAANREFHTGRELGDLYHGFPYTGNTTIDTVLANSPIARALTTARTLADARKGIGTKLANTLTPIHLTDVDVDKARRVAAQDLMREEFVGNPNIHSYTNFSVPSNQVGQLSPRDLMLMELYRTLNQPRKKIPAYQ